MKVILLKDIKGTGKKGDVINASDGHARNYLIPRKFAMEATDSNLKELNFKQANVAKIKKEELETAQKFASDFEKMELIISAKAGEGNKLFGSITSKDLSEALKEQFDLDIDKKKIVLKNSIKELGSYQIEIKVFPKVKGILKVTIISE
jgi:large subunit ribosomal protein L9